MAEHFADRCLRAMKGKGAAVCVGLDPVYQRLPKAILAEGPGDPTRDAGGAVKAIEKFCGGVLEAVAEHVAVVKIQSACFERYLWLGAEACHRLVAKAQRLGLLVILDAKRGDIGVSAEHYAAGCLGATRFADLGAAAGVDAMTVNTYLGPDALEPLVKVAAAEGKGLFALVRTSNPGSDALQNLELKAGGQVADAVAQTIAQLGSRPELVGQSGYSLLGAVVGATKPQDAERLRKSMGRQIFLVPGFGAQGGSADDVKACFNADGQGAIITASRSVLYAYEKSEGADWRQAVADAAIDMKRQIGALAAGVG